MDSNMRGGTEFDGSDLFADKKDWEAAAEFLANENEKLNNQLFELSRDVVNAQFQRDTWSVFAFTIGLLLGWFSWWVL